MHNITNNSEEVDYQGEFATLVNKALKNRGLYIADLARMIGIDRAAMSRAVSGQRRLSYVEVVKISQLLQIVPPSWNKVGVYDPNSRFLPLCGNIDATVWRVKGSVMIANLSPIRPIDIGDDDTREQQCYFVNEGPYSGEYAVCVKLNEIDSLDEDDIVVVEESISVRDGSAELSRLVLAIVQRGEDGSALVYLSDGESPPQPLTDFEIKGLVIGFYRAARKKQHGSFSGY